jgi:hypothetical protein
MRVFSEAEHGLILTGDNNRATQRRRNRLLRGTLYALFLASIGCGVGFIDSWAEAVAPEPDYYRIVFDDLARQHFLATTTPTVVKEDDSTKEFFEGEYNARNRKLGLPSAGVTVPEGGLLQFSYASERIGLEEIPCEIVEQNFNPTLTLRASPLALWVYLNRTRTPTCGGLIRPCRYFSCRGLAECRPASAGKRPSRACEQRLHWGLSSPDGVFGG